MKSRLVLTLVPLAGLLLAGCDKPQTQATVPAQTTPAAEPPPPPSPAPVPTGPSESEQRLEAQMQAMQDRQAELQRQLDEEKLARLEAEIAKERDLLEKEREAWRLEQELADARAQAAAPSRTASQEGGDVISAAYSSPGSYDYQTFYDDLAPYGTWYDSPDYGYVWQPSVYVSDTSWRPYTCGSWAWSDAGWTWCSDEPFGWATYHYGRWGRCRQRGWVWVPGDVWAPAWVSWRRSDSHVGWCPMPPETVYHRNYAWGASIDTDCGIHPSMYIFMPVRHFDRPVLRYCEPAAVSIQICGTTVNITNIFWRSGRVHCDGPKYDWIRGSVQRPVPQYTLAWDAGRPVDGRPAHRMEKDRLHVFAPKMDVPWNRTLQPRSKAPRLENTEFVRAEGGLPQKMREQFRREKATREQAAGSSKAARYVMERQQRLQEMEKSRQSLAAETQTSPETAKTSPAERSRPDRFPGKSGRVVSNPQPQTEGDHNRVQPVTSPQPETPLPDAGRTATTPVQGTRTGEPRRAKEAAPSRAPEPAKETAPSLPLPADAAAHEAEKQRLANEAAARAAATRAEAKTSNDRARRETLREREEAAKQSAAERDAALEQQRAAETSARNEAARKELENQRALRAQMEEQRRRSEAAKEQTEVERASNEKAGRGSDAETRDRSRAPMEERRRQQQESAEAQARAESQRAAMENQRRQAEAARAEQAARQREAMEQQRAALEEQRRQAQAEAQQRRAAEEDAARQREAMENQRRAAQEAAMEQQRRAAQEAAMEQQRRAAQEAAARQREAMENQRRAAEENARRQAEENSRRQAENAQREAMDKARRASEEAERRQAEDRGGGRRGK